MMKHCQSTTPKKLDLSRLVKNGIPESLILSVCPPHVENTNIPERSRGKCPARFDINSGSWIALASWNSPSSQGINASDLQASFDKGANAGLLLGTPVPGELYQFAALDIDVNKIDTGDCVNDEVVSINLCDKILKWVRNYLKTDFYVRRTLPYRAAIILKIPSKDSPGRKASVSVNGEKSHDNVFNLEFLTGGQQVVIAGKHYSGNDIRWGVYGSESMECNSDTDCFINDSHVPVVSIEMIKTLLDEIVTYCEFLEGYRTTRCGDGTRCRENSGKVESYAPDSCPPSAQDFINLINLIPHGDNVTREGNFGYVNIMIASAGCIRALAGADKISDEEKEYLESGIIKWAASWNPSSGKKTAWK